MVLQENGTSTRQWDNYIEKTKCRIKQITRKWQYIDKRIRYLHVLKFDRGSSGANITMLIKKSLN